MISANRGEWSELYVVARLLSAGGGYLADKNQQAIPGSFLKVLRLFLENSEGPKTVFRLTDSVSDHVALLVGGIEEKTISKVKLADLSDELLSDLQSSNFHEALESGNKLLTLLGRQRPSASSSQSTNDLQLEILDEEIEKASRLLGFSIKSQLGSAATLLNASRATNLTFELSKGRPLDSSEISELNALGLTGLLARLKNRGYELNFVRYENAQFLQNLRVVDSQMPKYMASMVLTSYWEHISNLRDVAAATFSEADAWQPIFKTKEFLGAVAMGLRPTNDWDGDPSMFKGILLAKSDGEVLFYYLYNVIEFRDFLFNNLKFERGDRTRHDYGRLYSEGGKTKIRLNLQLRFIR